MKLFALNALLIFSLSINAQDINSLPYQTSFEGAEGNLNENFPEGWSAEDLNIDALGNQGWQIIKNSDFSQNTRTDSTAVHMLSNTSASNDDWLFTPSFNVSAGLTYSMSFWYKVNTFASSEKLKVHAGSSASGTDMASAEILWDEDNLTNQDYMQGLATFTAESDDIMHFGFHYYSDEFQFILLIDDVEIDILIPGDVAAIGAAPSYEFYLSEDGLASFKTENLKQGIISVSDITGKKIRSKAQFSINGNMSITIQDLPRGTYLVSLSGIKEEWIVSEKVSKY